MEERENKIEIPSEIVATNKTQKQLEIIRRKELAVELRLRGYTYREVYELMISFNTEGKVVLPESYDERYAYRDVRSILDEIKQNLIETGEELRAVELMTLNKLQSAIMDKALAGNLLSVDRVLNIMARRERYVPDLVEPKSINVKTWQSELIELMRAGKITIKDVQDVSPEIAETIMARLDESGGATGLPNGSVTLEGEYSDLGETNK